MRTAFTAILLTISLFCLVSCQQTATNKQEHPPYVRDWRSKCVTIRNASTKVVIDPWHGGRIAEYSLNGKNILHEVTENHNWVYPHGVIYFGPTGGRFDVGPEVPVHEILWEKAWQVEKADKYHIRIRSQKDPAAGLQLVREFTLSPDSSVLTCKQTMINISEKPMRCSFWGRSIVKGGGIGLAPISEWSRFPMKYVGEIGWPDFTLFTQPKARKNPQIRIFNDFAAITGKPGFDKIGFDSTGGWLAYLGKDNLLFTKKFNVYPGREYPDVAGLTSAFWFHKNEMCEVEPLGPIDVLQPGKSASFQVEWQLSTYQFPENINQKSLQKLHQKVLSIVK